MSIIQRIREKGALISAIVIALALLGFIAMDAFSGRSGMAGGNSSSSVGSVNGQKININEFRQMVALTEQNMEQQGAPSGEATTQQAIETAWNQEINRTLQEQELDKLGLTLSQKEMSDLLYGPNPSPIARQYLWGQQDAPYNPDQVRQTIRQIERSSNVEQKTQLAQLLKYIEQERLSQKFNSLLANTVNVPKWRIEKQNAENSQMASVSYVRKPYSDILDSTIKITDDEVRTYINKHKDQFKQNENRSINYVTFNASPSSEDTAQTRSEVTEKATAMISATDMVSFLAGEGESNYYDGYISGNRIQIANKDSIFRTPVGQVYGPYLDGGSFTIARIMGVKQMPDTVKIRHILISTAQQDQQTGQWTTVRDSATARHLIDSVQGLIRGGAIFDSVCAKLSEDGTKDKGGVYENVPTGQMVPTFNDYIFGNPVGSKGIVQTPFGFHYIEILSQKGSSTAYKVAYLSKPILVSSKTDADASSAASMFAGNSPNEKAFNETFEKQLKPKGYNKGIAYDITPNGYNVMGLGVSRDFVRNVYAAKRGHVLQPQKVGSNYVVAVVTEVNEKGTQSVAKARPMVEQALRNQKKAEIIKKQIGAITTLEAAGIAMGGKLVENADSIRIFSGGPIGYEAKVLGAAFNAANRGKVVPEAIDGQVGVYVIKVNSVIATPSVGGSVEEQRKAEIERAKQQATYSSPLQFLKEAASIKDNRSKHY